MARPEAAEIEVLEWPVPKWSKGLSAMRGKPLTPPMVRRVWKLSLRPVSSL